MSSNPSGNTNRAQTECHRLVQREEWQVLVDRLKTGEGIIEAKTRDSQQRLIFHLDNVYKAPLYVIRAMYEAHSEGWMSPLCRHNTNGEDGVITYPIFLCIKKITQQNLMFLLQKIPGAAKQRECTNLPLHKACRLGDDATVRLLLAAYPDSASKESNRGYLPFAEGLGQLKTETLLMLLSSYSPAVAHRLSNANLPLHTALELCLDDYLITSIFHSFPDACRMKGFKGRLPIHSACAVFGPTTTVSRDTFKMILNEHPLGASDKDERGRLPLHLLCMDTHDHQHKIDFLNELLDAHPGGALEQDEDDSYPINLLMEGEWDDGCTGFPEEAWLKLIEVAPQGLVHRSGVESPFIAMARMMAPSESVWRATTLHYPRAIYEVDATEGSALEIELSHEGIDWQRASSTGATLALKKTFQALRGAFGLRSDDPIVNDFMPQLHKLIYCGHLFRDLSNLPLPLANDLDHDVFLRVMTQQDSIQGNNPLHVVCCAPCPPSKNVEFESCSSSLIATILKRTPEEEQLRCLSTRNETGEIPLHMLLKNEYPCKGFLLADIQNLIEKSIQGGSVWDPSERLYPFMICASLASEERHSLSATYLLLHAFTACRNLSRFANYDETTTMSPPSPKRQRVED